MKNKIWEYPENMGVECPICKTEMIWEENVIRLIYFCENPKCSAFLLRHGGIEKSLSGMVKLSRLPGKIKYFQKNVTLFDQIVQPLFDLFLPGQTSSYRGNPRIPPGGKK